VSGKRLLIALVTLSLAVGWFVPPGAEAMRTANWVVTENARTGTNSWKIAEGTPRDVEGFANRTSVDRGGSFLLYVRTSAPTYVVTAYRLGYYQGLGGRRVWRSDPTARIRQPAATVDPVTNMVAAPWNRSMRVSTQGWPQGSYVLKLVSSAGGASYVPMVVRNDRSTAALVFVQQVNTWEAYNQWGGYSLYDGPAGFDDRSRVVSFDRPYDASGAGGMFRALPFIAIAEQRGMDITYVTDVDLQLRPTLLQAHHGVILFNHSEYWSATMRDALLAARGAGVNIADFGANAIYRHIRYEDSPLGRARRIVCYKVGTEDPLWGLDPAEVTVNWRSSPVPRPESAITGAMYGCHGVSADMVVADPTAWVFANTGLAAGTHIRLAVSGEVDAVFPSAPTPSNLQILAHSPVSCGGAEPFAAATYYTATSGAGVIDIGATDWYRTIRCGLPWTDGRCSVRAVQITRNVLRVFAKGPAGAKHPAVGNTADFGYVLQDPIAP
jgi:hypothetical protein